MILSEKIEYLFLKNVQSKKIYKFVMLIKKSIRNVIFQS